VMPTRLPLPAPSRAQRQTGPRSRPIPAWLETGIIKNRLGDGSTQISERGSAVRCVEPAGHTRDSVCIISDCRGYPRCKICVGEDSSARDEGPIPRQPCSHNIHIWKIFRRTGVAGVRPCGEHVPLLMPYSLRGTMRSCSARSRHFDSMFPCSLPLTI
jgi:hypothetical protein